MSDTITLKALCDELNVAPKAARKRLRAALKKPKAYPELVKSHKHRGTWQWATASEAETEARSALAVIPVSSR